MNIQLSDQLLKNAETAENLIAEIEEKIGHIAPDMASSIASKGHLLQMLTYFDLIKKDIKAYREGTSLKDVQKKAQAKSQKNLKDMFGSLGTFIIEPPKEENE